MAKKERYVSPKGEALWAKLDTPDYTFKDDGELSIDLVVDEDTAEAMREKHSDLLKEQIAEVKKEKKSKKIKLAANEGMSIKPQENEEGEETGKYVIKFSTVGTTRDGTEKTVPVFDAKGNKLDTALKVGNGSTVKVCYSPSAYYSAALGAGVKLYLNAVQVLDLVEFSGGSAESYGFEEEEGFEAAAESDDFGETAEGEEEDNDDDEHDF